MKDNMNFKESSFDSEKEIDETKLLMAFKEATDAKIVQRLVKDFNLEIENSSREKNSSHWIQINHTDRRYWLKSIDNRALNDDEIITIERRLGDKIEWIGKVYRNINSKHANLFCPIPNVFLIEKTRKNDAILRESVKKMGYTINELKSKYLTRYYYLEIIDVKAANSLQLSTELNRIFGKVKFENMPMYKPLAATIPNDSLWSNQWNMVQINAPNGWDISTGVNTTVICILDEGCDLTHPDLQFSEQGINLDTMLPTGEPTGNHGTACAGIAAATFNNVTGVAGVAGNCSIMPIAFQNWTDVECANGINYAANNGANVISMSFGVYDGWGWDYNVIDPEIQIAFNADLVLCAATGNEDDGTTNRYPGRHPLVIAVGGSSSDDNRKTPLSPDGEGWGANFGEDVYNGISTGVSVVAPCVLCPTTDRQGNVGYDINVGTAGDYAMTFNGTSAATPHVAGLAGLIISQYPTLTNVEVRNIIERTAAKVGTAAYTEQIGFSNGTRNQEMGYGRIDVLRALDFSDVMIKDWTGDNGNEPSTPPSGNFWDFSDIVVRINDDDVFNPSNPSQSKNVERGQSNYIYVKVTNNGPRDASNVSVNIRITPYIGLQFVFPTDWNLVDSMHVNPNSITSNFSSIPSGTSAIAKFSITAAQVESLYGWENSNPWHPCLLAQVTADNDFAYATADLSFGNIVVRKNNFAQRNLSVIDVMAGATLAFPFIAGSLFSNNNFIKLSIDKSRLPQNALVKLKVDNNEKIFPLVNFDNVERENYGKEFKFFEKSKIISKVGCCDAEITFEKGSKISLQCDDNRKLKLRNIIGGEITVKNGETNIEVKSQKSIVTFDSSANSIFAISVEVNIPNTVKKDEEYYLVVSQLDDRNSIIGGASVLYKVK
jgi:Subtilase family